MATLTAAVVLCAAAVAPAIAAKSVVTTIGDQGAGSTGGLFKTPNGIAVNVAGAGGVPAGTFYVVDGGNRRIERFGPDGGFVAAWGWDVDSPSGGAAYEICTVAAECLAGDPGNGAGQLESPQGIAVDQENGIVYVSDNGQRRINAYSAAGTFYGAFGWGALDGSAEFQYCTTVTTCHSPNTSSQTGGQAGKFGSNGLGGLAVDSSARLLVADETNRRVDVFAPTLVSGALTGIEFLRAFGKDVSTEAGSGFEVCHGADCKRGGTGTGEGEFANNSPIDVAVDSEDHAFALDEGNQRVQEFDSTPTVVDQAFGSAALAAAFGDAPVLGGLAVDPGDDHVFVLGGEGGTAAIAATGPSTGTLTVKAYGGSYYLLVGAEFTQLDYDASASEVQASLEALAGIGSGNIAVAGGPGSPDGSTPYEITLTGALSGHEVTEIAVYATLFSPPGPVRVQEVDSSGAAAGGGPHGGDIAHSSANGIAVSPEAVGGNIFVSSSEETNRVYVLNDTVPTVGNVDGIGPHSATLHGEVVSDELEVKYHFEYSADGATWVKLPGSDATAGPAPGTVAVEATTESELQGNRTYAFRLVATRPGGGFALKSALGEFTTDGAPPKVSGVSAGSVTSSGAELSGEVNPENQVTRYQFEYLTAAAYAANGDSFSGAEAAARVPAEPFTIGGGGSTITVSEQLNGLAAETTYRFRLLATNASEETGEAEVTFTTYAPPQVFPACAGDRFRAGAGVRLPDCRAYEQVSPVDKNGGSLQASVALAKASVNGDGATFESSAGVPGGEGSQAFPSYVATRHAGGWSTQGLLPPASFGTVGVVLGWTPDFAKIFSRAETAPTVDGTFLQRSTNGSPPVEIVPRTSPPPSFRYAGASADNATVIFRASGELDLPPGGPAPAAGENNLYAWDEQAEPSERLSLAGILPNDTAPAAGSSVANGRGYAQDTHAVSEDGSVFFTDEGSGQLYLRQHPADEEAAQTLHVSDSEKTNGSGPGGRDAAGAKPATFQGASAGGEAALFTSSEKLTNDATTGPEVTTFPTIAQAPIGGGAADFEFLPTTAHGLALEGNYLYWADPAVGTIGRADVSAVDCAPDPAPCDIIPAFVDGAGVPQYVAVDASHIYWTNDADTANEAGSIGRADLADGGNVSPSCITGASNPQGIAVGVGGDSGHVYWANHGTSQATRRIARADIGSSCAASDASANQTFISTSISTSQMEGMAVTASQIYWGVNSNGNIGHAPIDGSSSGSVCVALVSAKDGIAVDGTYIYWSNTEEGSIGRVGLDCATDLNPTWIADAGQPSDLAVDGTSVYWSADQEEHVNPGNDLYRYQVDADGEGHHLTDISVDEDVADTCPASGGQPCGADVQGVLGSSANTSYVYFVANGLPEGLDVASNGNGEEAELGDCQGPPQSATGECNLYLWQADPEGGPGSTTFIARLDADSEDAWNWVLSPDEILGLTAQRTARVTPDGRTLLFRSIRQLTAYDNEGNSELYLFRAGEPDLLCVSCNPTGAPPAGPVSLGSLVVPFKGGGVGFNLLSRNLSSGGDRVFFESDDALVAGDANGDKGCPAWGSGNQLQADRSCRDVYEWEAKGTGSCQSEAQNGGCLYLVSTGESPDASFFADADADGSNVFIFTSSRLVGQDRDGLIDVYDARVDGGLAAQNETEPTACDGEACRGQLTPPPATQSPGSAGFSGAGNQQVKRHHKKKRHKKRKRNKHRRHAKRRQRGKKGRRAGKRTHRHRRDARTIRGAGR